MHLYPAAIAWVTGGAIGAVFRILLWVKFRGDMAAASISEDGNLRRVVSRSIESTLLHLGIKAGVIAIGVSAMFQAPQQTAAGQQDTYGLVVTVVLIGIPWVLTFDAVREYMVQNAILGGRAGPTNTRPEEHSAAGS